MPTIERLGARLAYDDQGHGEEVVLLLHAFPLNAGMWAGLLPALSPRYRVVAPDYPGLGRSAPRSRPATMEALAEDVLAILDHLGVTRASVVGLSMGGYLAFEIRRRRPDLVRALALCDTRAGADTPEGAAGRETFARTAIERGLGWVADEMLPKLLKPRPDPGVADRVRTLIAQGTPEGVAAAQRAMATRRDSTSALPRITCPTLVVVGALDAMTPPAESRAMAAAIPGAALVEIPDAGHLSNLEDPEAFGRSVVAFLDAHRG